MLYAFLQVRTCTNNAILFCVIIWKSAQRAGKCIGFKLCAALFSTAFVRSVFRSHYLASCARGSRQTQECFWCKVPVVCCVMPTSGETRGPSDCNRFSAEIRTRLEALGKCNRRFPELPFKYARIFYNKDLIYISASRRLDYQHFTCCERDIGFKFIHIFLYVKL